MKKLVYLVSVFLLSNVYAFSQQTDKTINDSLNLDEFVITGTLAKINKNNVHMSVSVVNNEQIIGSSESAILPVLNGRIPGLFVTERGVTGFGVSTGAAGQITMRGIGGSPTTGVLMLIDGHPQFMGIFGHPLADSYVTSDVEKVEVIRGPGSILYGSNAMGGVVNIITRKQKEDGFHTNANVMYGSYNTQKYMANIGYKKNGFSVFASGNHNQTDGHRANSDFNINNGYIKLGYELNKHFRANTDFSIAQFTATDPGPDTINAKKGNTLDITRGYWAFDLENEFKKFSGAIKLFYNFGEHNISDGFHSNDANYGINIHETTKLFKGNNISIGADVLNYGGKAENTLAMSGKGIVFKDTTIIETAVYGLVQQTVFNKLTLNAGIRYQNHSVYGEEWIPSGGFTFQLLKNTTWKASASEGFRSPTIQELYIWNHNSNLNPEKIMSYETSILQSFFNNKLNLELTGFKVEGDNMIITVPLLGLQNAGSISNMGIEFAANARVVKNLDFSLTYSYIDMKTPVYGTPKHNLFSSVGYTWKKISATVSAQYINNLDTDPSVAKVNYENYTLLNAKLSYRPWKYVEVFASTENLLNEIYENVRYYTMPGITVFGGINLKF
ncbi:MAG: TonB-dependent receptor [Paludibacteraceae bacterium]|nr:TonB-dependent receptor [Paludibacteraceae bacterium]MBN2788492.1 TonB-dependent receptor [Paludibacteraceae bacterium]